MSIDPYQAALRLAYPGQLDRQERLTRALQVFEKYLGVIGSTLEDPVSPMVVVAFKGYLAVELAMFKSERISIAWSICDWLVMQGVLHKDDVQLAMSQDEAFNMFAYLTF